MCKFDGAVLVAHKGGLMYIRAVTRLTNTISRIIIFLEYSDCTPKSEQIVSVFPSPKETNQHLHIARQRKHLAAGRHVG